ncbi:MAG: ATP-binding protein [bacterium]|nr:ATP-binding protein [bacterium]
MIVKDLSKITENDLDDLIKNQVIESRTIEYKEMLPGNTDADRKEFLADTSAFANTAGGDIIYGIKEENGLPIEIMGVDLSDLDTEIQKLDQVINSGLQPRIQYHIQPIKLKNNNHIFIIRVKQSIIKPHRVIFKGHDKFYGRGANRKYGLDVEELRTTFLLANTIGEKIKDFHTSRIIDIESGRTPIPLRGENKIIIHFIPLESFTTATQLSSQELDTLRQQVDKFIPIHGRNYDIPLINFDGILAYASSEKEIARTYTQLFRKKIIESVETSILERDNGNPIPSLLFEQEIIKHVKHYIQYLKTLEVNTPIYVIIALTNVEGLNMSHERAGYIYGTYPIRQKMINLPEIIFESYDQNVANSLKPVFDLVWNACGISESVYSKKKDPMNSQ